MGTATETPETTAAAIYFEKKPAEVETAIPDERQVADFAVADFAAADYASKREVGVERGTCCVVQMRP